MELNGVSIKSKASILKTKLAGITMATTLTLTGDTIYMRLLQESDMDTIAGSLTGFREFRTDYGFRFNH